MRSQRISRRNLSLSSALKSAEIRQDSSGFLSCRAKSARRAAARISFCVRRSLCFSAGPFVDCLESAIPCAWRFLSRYKNAAFSISRGISASHSIWEHCRWMYIHPVRLHNIESHIFYTGRLQCHYQIKRAAVYSASDVA